MRKIIREILYDNRKDPASLPLRALLRSFSFLYGAAIFLRNMLYDRKLLNISAVPCRVISIGNITVGGTGKTPVTIMTARFLVQAGYRIAVVSRGYGREGNGVLVVSDMAGIRADSVEAGDEPHLIAASLPGVPVVVGKDRHSAAMAAYTGFHPDIILLDDAFQHRSLGRDADIVTLDAEYPFGNGNLLPRGILRESPLSLSRARAVIVTRCPGESRFSEIRELVREFNPDVAVFRSRHVPRAFRLPAGAEAFALSVLDGKKVAALSNTANPSSFYRLLESLGAEIVLKRSMDDHHRYRSEELAHIRKEVLLSGAEALVMTAKDERNLPGKYRPEGKIPEYVLDIEAVLDGDEKQYLSIVTGKELTP